MNPIVLTMGALAALVGIGLLVRFSGMRQYLGNILIPCFVIAWSLVFLAVTFSLPVEKGGPTTIPRFWITLLLVLSSLLLWRVFLGKDEAVPKIKRPGLLALVMAIVVGYYFAIPLIGYFLSTFLFIVLALHVLGYPRKWLIYVIAVGWIMISYFGFYKVLQIQLPLGFFDGLF